MKFIDLANARKFLAQAVEHYDEQNAPSWLVRWLNDLYVRLGESWQSITLDELITAQIFFDGGSFVPVNYACNLAYKMFRRISRDTTGIIA